MTSRPDFEGKTYPQRWQMAVADQESMTIFVPAVEGLFTVAPRSAIVGKHLTGLRYLCHYEGWVHGAMQYADLDARGQWEAGVRHAAGRALTDYPTRARMVVPGAWLQAVGTYHAAADSIDITDEEALNTWLV